MKKILLLIITGAMLMSGCNNSEFESGSNSIPQSNKGAAQTTEPALSDNPSSDVSPTSAQISSVPAPSKEENTLNILITVNGQNFSATLQDNKTAREFKARLPLTLDMSELNGNEKYYYLPDSLPTNSGRPSRINTGDIMLYGNNCLVIFYESFSTLYSYTPIGKIDDPGGLAAALGSGSVQVSFNASPNN